MGLQILYCSQLSALKVIKNTSWSDSQSIFLDTVRKLWQEDASASECFFLLFLGLTI